MWASLQQWPYHLGSLLWVLSVGNSPIGPLGAPLNVAAQPPNSEADGKLSLPAALKQHNASLMSMPPCFQYIRLQKMEHGCRTICAGFPSFFGLGLVDGHDPTFWFLLQSALCPSNQSRWISMSWKRISDVTRSAQRQSKEMDILSIGHASAVQVLVLVSYRFKLKGAPAEAWAGHRRGVSAVQPLQSFLAARESISTEAAGEKRWSFILGQQS